MLQKANPREGFFQSQRLNLHYVEWGRDGADPVLLVHGFRDHCRSWDFVARALESNYHIFAVDLRGHGDSDWNNSGTYCLDDHIYDLHTFIDRLGLTDLSIISHSMGGAVSLSLAGLFPNRIKRLIAIEGMWELERPIKQVKDDERFHGWIRQLDSLSKRAPVAMRSLEAAECKFKARHSRLSSELIHHLTSHAVRRNVDGTLTWKHDPSVQARASGHYDRAAIIALWQRITCPVLLVHGSESEMSDPRTLGFDRYFQRCQTAIVNGANHWVHHDKLDDFLALAREALSG